MGQYQPQRQTTVAKPVTNFVNSYQTKPTQAVEERISTTTYRNPLKEDIYSSSKQDNSKSIVSLNSLSYYLLLVSISFADKDFDEIFKGSHSSNFYNNRNNGKEDEFEDFKVEPQPTTTTTTSTQRPAHRGRQRGRVHYNNANQISSGRKIKSTTAAAAKQHIATSPRTVEQFTTQSAPTQNRINYNTALPQQQNNDDLTFFKSASITPLTNLQKSVPTTRAYNVLDRTQSQNFPVQKQQHQQPIQKPVVQNQSQNLQPFQQLQQNNQSDLRNQQFYDNFENKSPQPFKINEYQPTSRPTTTTTSTTTSAPKLLRPLQDPFKVTYNVQSQQTDNFRSFQPTIQTTTVVPTNLNSPTLKLKPQEPIQQFSNNQFFAQQEQHKPITTPQPKYNNNYQQQINFGKSDFNGKTNEFTNQFNKFNDFHQSTKSVGSPSLASTERSSTSPVKLNPNNAQDKGQFNGNFLSKTTANDKPIQQTQTNVEQQPNRGNNQQQLSEQNRDFSRALQQHQNVESFNRGNNNYQQNVQKDFSRNTPETKQTQSPSFAPVPTTFNPQLRFKSSNSPSTDFASSSPRGFLQQQTTAGHNKQQPIHRNSNENYTPASVKRFSTLVPRELYDPTTFKPTTYQRSYEAFRRNEEQSPAISNTKTAPFVYTPTVIAPTTTRTTTTTTVAPIFAAVTPKPHQQYPTKSENDEDDGQYRPELYEQDFYRNRYNRPVQSKSESNVNAFNINYNTQTSSSPAQIYDKNSNNDDELFQTAHSQNIAASGNELRVAVAKKAEQEKQKQLQQQQQKHQQTQQQPQKQEQQQHQQKQQRPQAQQTVQQQQSQQQPQRPQQQQQQQQVQQQRPQQQRPQQQTPQQQKPFSRAPTISPTATSTRKPVLDDKDASYDYAYYDSSVNDNPHEYSEYSIADFGKTKSPKKH